ncbi:hypothetical protein [Nocardia gamkensis]|uniref:hypothetical protein n=1 Tax=Nocardia gamkensis TaxID=352869 RepID=UPI0037CA2DAC
MEQVVASGRWRGEARGAVAVFRGIPYARAERFGAPEPVEAHEGVYDATRRYAIAPQLPGRLEGVMGRAEALGRMRAHRTDRRHRLDTPPSRLAYCPAAALSRHARKRRTRGVGLPRRL